MPDLSKITLKDYLGSSADSLIDQLTTLKLDDDANKYIVGQWIIDKAGKSRRSFSYGADAHVASADPNAAATFAPTFVHNDWRDGEDLVEAEGIDGFNSRFNALRADLDTVKADLEKTFACLGQLRRQVANALEEIKAELNTINGQVYECCAEPVKGGGGPIVYRPDKVPPIYYEPRPTPDPIRWPLPESPYTPIDPTSPPRTWWYDKIWRDPADPNSGILGAKPVKRIDVTKFNGKDMDIWQTDFGLMLTESAAGATTTKPRYEALEIERVRTLTRYLGDNSAEIKAAFASGFTTKEFAAKYGGVKLGSDVLVADLLKDLPDDMKFTTADKLADSVAERQAKALTDAGQGQIALVGVVGLNAGTPIEKVALADAKFTDARTARALTDAGIGDIAALSSTDTAKIKSVLDAAGISTTLGEAASLRGVGKTVGHVGRLSR